ncbi:MAG: TRAP transporter large permease subunit [Gammaproteobacteria bacterium]|jgi:tripartite ATP-independent transporter DctM subunit|nr:TRAP transporter large permease subunit [Gammaproteobacteria bacterium]MBT3722130.1 TRAP transporter large permease subunit [Gammaproteobacteria bacterium]MBT4194619.1 TRAP transporter large permease subunit [Gammaproteobacteria bacterium]MBT4448893.1 TRAP transporter large permease subunit [Gammaproteobacteria bacterium]MBT4863123.1 TRAP transporter large permease subunit [Gammaproteobacteria bacterium]
MEVYFLLLLVILMIAALTSGFPVAFALPGSAILSIAIAALCGYLFVGDPDAFFSHGGPNQWLSAGVTNFRSMYWVVERDTLIAIPLFVFMGIMLQRSKIAEDLLVAMAQLFGPVPGGLGISVIFVGALLAATTGIVGATVIAMGLISLPAMLRNNYSKSLACGTICASGTLGQIIPPSIVLIILADQLSSAADQANTARKSEYREVTGEFSMPSDFDVVSASAGDMFMGAFVPGLILVGLYMAYIFIAAVIKPEVAPPVPYDGKYNRQFFIKVLMALAPPLLLIFTVLGSIVLGIATVNQAGAIGAVGALIMGSYRLTQGSKTAYYPAILAIVSLVAITFLLNNYDLNIKNIKTAEDQFGVYLATIAVSGLLISVVWAIWRAHKIDNILHDVMIETAKTTSMVFIILLGAAMLTSAFRAFGGEELVKQFLTTLPGGFWMQFVVVMAVIFLLGFFLDFIEIAVVVVPIVAPILLANPEANVTAVWLGVMVGLNIQTSFLTPPFGFALFYLRGVAPAIVKTLHIYKGAIAFIGLQLVGLFIAGAFPTLINYLPNRTYLTSDTAPPPNNPRIQLCLEDMVFGGYARQKNDIEQALKLVKKLDTAYFPDKYRQNLNEGFNDMSKVFATISQIEKAEKDLQSYVVEYEPLHREVRSIQRDVRKIGKKIELLEDGIKQIEFSEEPDESAMKDLENQIAELKSDQQLLTVKIPEQWKSAREQYLALAKKEKIARNKYRRLVDDSYQVVVDTRLMIAAADELKQLQPELEALFMVIRDAEFKDAMAQIKVVESSLSSIKNAHPVKSKLSKARRALKKTQDRDKASGQLVKAIQILEVEIEWRTSAKKKFSHGLEQFDNVVKNTVGLRMQDRLKIEQAEEIAGCLAHHKDISLAF